MTNKKFDQFGNYLRFPGFTVVADVVNPNQDVFQAIFDKLKSNALLLEYNALLPVESYHITQFSIISQKTMTDDQWHNWFKSQAIRLRATHRELESGTNPFSFRIVGVDKRRITFLVEVSNVANEEQKQVADVTGYSEHMPHHFHISLGYQHKKFTDKTTVNVITEAVEQALRDVLGDEYATVDLQAGQPKLCYYHSMTEFVPCDCSVNPFLSTSFTG